MIELALRGTTRYWLWMLTLILLSLALRRITGYEAGEGPHPLTKPDADLAAPTRPSDAGVALPQPTGTEPGSVG